MIRKIYKIVVLKDYCDNLRGFQMLTPKGVDQLLSVLTKFRSAYANGHHPSQSLQDAVDKVRKEYNVTYQTIEDLCRRRLGLERIERLHNLLEKWVIGDSDPLKNVLLQHADTICHRKISDYFNHEKPLSISQTSQLQEPFTLRLDTNVVKKFKVLELMVGPSEPDWLAKKVSDIIDERYDKWLNEQR